MGQNVIKIRGDVGYQGVWREGGPKNLNLEGRESTGWYFDGEGEVRYILIRTGGE